MANNSSGYSKGDMFAYIRYGDDIGVNLCLEKGVYVDARDDEEGGLEQTALMIASKSGNLKITTRLIENGAKINAKDKNGRTALIYAIGNNNLDIVKLLIENGADVNAKFISYYHVFSNEEKTALVFAVERNNLEIVKVLIDNGALINVVDKNGTLLLSKVFTKNKEIIEYFFKKGIIIALDEEKEISDV